MRDVELERDSDVVAVLERDGVGVDEGDTEGVFVAVPVLVGDDPGDGVRDGVRERDTV